MKTTILASRTTADTLWHAFDPQSDRPDALCGRTIESISPNIPWADLDIADGLCGTCLAHDLSPIEGALEEVPATADLLHAGPVPFDDFNDDEDG